MFSVSGDETQTEYDAWLALDLQFQLNPKLRFRLLDKSLGAETAPQL